MIRHLLRIVWNRRRANVLVAAEIFLSFLVLAVVATLGLYLLDNYRQPLGFSYERVWTVRVVRHTASGDMAPGAALPFELTPAGQRQRVATLLRLVRDLPNVEAVTASTNAPYGPSSWTSSINAGGRAYDFGASEATDAFAETMGVRVTRGRWFSAADDGAAWRPTVLNERLARQLFGAEDPVGKTVQEDPPKIAGGPPPPPAMRVVGVISDFRKDGELEPPPSYAFFRNNLDASYSGPRIPSYLLIRVRPGTPAAFEETLAARLQQAEPAWSFRTSPMSLSRAATLRSYLPGIATAALIAGFLLLMVMMGLTGVLWQMVTQRTREIGLRRAQGATIPDIRHQVLGEVLVMTSVAVAAGSIVVVQLPVLDWLGVVPLSVYATGFGLAVTCIVALAVACAWMPSRLATAVPPAEALRYE